MNWNKMNSLENVVVTSYDTFDKALELGLIIYYDQNSKLNILSTESLESLCSNLMEGSSYYEVFDSNIYLNFKNEIKLFEANNCSLQTFCNTSENEIMFFNSEYCIGATSIREPKFNRRTVILAQNNRTVYSWSDNKDLIVWKKDRKIFCTKFKGDLYSLNIDSGTKKWNLNIDSGIMGRRGLYFLDNDHLISQKHFSLGVDNLININLHSGEILWEIEKAMTRYTYDEKNKKMYGLQNDIFEVIDYQLGKKVYHKNLNNNFQIASHLSYYSNGNLYFSGRTNDDIPIVGAINVSDGDLVFTIEVKLPGKKSMRKGLHKPIVVCDKLYVKDTLNTLHIYENRKATS